MRILITNDDGIDSPALPTLIRWAKRLGDVFVLAPAVEQSCKSHSVEIHSSFAVDPVDTFPGVTAYRVASTPVDCIRLAFLWLDLRPDLVLSGVNRGFNLGNDIAYSGTVSAVKEAASYGSRAVALSVNGDDYESAFDRLDDLWHFFDVNGLWEKHPVYNVNFPQNAKGIRMTRQGGVYVTDSFVRTEDGKIKPKYLFAYKPGTDLSLDTDAVTGGYVSVTPLTWDNTDRTVYDETAALSEDFPIKR